MSTHITRDNLRTMLNELEQASGHIGRANNKIVFLPGAEGVFNNLQRAIIDLRKMVLARLIELRDAEPRKQRSWEEIIVSAKDDPFTKSYLNVVLRHLGMEEID